MTLPEVKEFHRAARRILNDERVVSLVDGSLAFAGVQSRDGNKALDDRLKDLQQEDEA